MHRQVTSVEIHAHSPQFMATMTGHRILCPSGGTCLADVRRLNLLSALKRCGLCDKRKPFKRVFKCRSCRMVYHNGCLKRLEAAAAAATAVTVTDALPAANYRESPVVLEPTSRVHAAAGSTANPTTETPGVRVEGVRDILADIADRRQRAVHAAERRRRDVLAEAGSTANRTTQTAWVPVADVRDTLAADRRQRAVHAAERRRRDVLAAAGSTANRATETARVRVEGVRDTLVADRRRRAVQAAESRRLAGHAAARTEVVVYEQPAVESSTAGTTEPALAIDSASLIVVRGKMLAACEYFKYLTAEQDSRQPYDPKFRRMTRRDYKEMSASWDASTFKRPKNNESARTVYSLIINNSTIAEAADLI